MLKNKFLLSVLLLLALLFFGCNTNNTNEPSIFGSWLKASLTVDGIPFTDMLMTVNKDGTFAASYTEYELAGGWQAGSHYGTFSPSSLPENTVITFHVISGSGLYPGPGGEYYVKYDSLTDSTVNMYLDFMNDGYEGPFAMQGQ